jgi:hypothetical protein
MRQYIAGRRGLYAYRRGSALLDLDPSMFPNVASVGS